MFTWRIHSGLVPGRELEVADIIRGQGDQVQLVSGPRQALAAPLAAECSEDGGLALTTLQDAQQLMGYWLKLGAWGGSRMLYAVPHRYAVSFWLPRISPSLPVLNRNGVFVPLGMVQHVPLSLWQYPFPADNGLLFIRPDSGQKLFSGFVLNCLEPKIQDWAGVAAALSIEANGMSPEQLVCISPGHALMDLEWRFWVVNRQVVASTPYSWAEGTVPWQPPPEEAQQLAQTIAENPWQPDIAYVVDIVQLADTKEFYLNELNAASTSGLYNVPFAPLLTALKAAVYAEIAGELSLED